MKRKLHKTSHVGDFCLSLQLRSFFIFSFFIFIFVFFTVILKFFFSNFVHTQPLRHFFHTCTRLPHLIYCFHTFNVRYNALSPLPFNILFLHLPQKRPRRRGRTWRGRRMRRPGPERQWRQQPSNLKRCLSTSRRRKRTSMSPCMHSSSMHSFVHAFLIHASSSMHSSSMHSSSMHLHPCIPIMYFIHPFHPSISSIHFIHPFHPSISSIFFIIIPFP